MGLSPKFRSVAERRSCVAIEACTWPKRGTWTLPINPVLRRSVFKLSSRTVANSIVTVSVTNTSRSSDSDCSPSPISVSGLVQPPRSASVHPRIKQTVGWMQKSFLFMRVRSSARTSLLRDSLSLSLQNRIVEGVDFRNKSLASAERQNGLIQHGKRSLRFGTKLF